MTLLKSINKVPTLADLGHSWEVSELALVKSGVVLVSGRHGSGKSTTLASLAAEVKDKTGQLVVEITAAEDGKLGLPLFTIEDRPYKSVSKNPRREDLEAARRFSLLEAAAIIKEGVQVAVFDDIRHAEAALIASYLAESGMLVLASIHNSGDAQNTITAFTALPGKLRKTPLDSDLVEAVVHQSLSSGKEPVLTSSVVVRL